MSTGVIPTDDYNLVSLSAVPVPTTTVVIFKIYDSYITARMSISNESVSLNHERVDYVIYSLKSCEFFCLPVATNGKYGAEEHFETAIVLVHRSFDASKSTKGASKLRRDLINTEIGHLRDLLPLPASTRQRLSQLQLMALVTTKAFLSLSSVGNECLMIPRLSLCPAASNKQWRRIEPTTLKKKTRRSYVAIEKTPRLGDATSRPE
uniref:NPAS4 bHLH domain-containing protein n=1 Tax=Daphnia galeata TaxID=27404 RepID=A0A8J2WQU1_9CRUS|nr:unnamed protein product [Daphnia galeata]